MAQAFPSMNNNNNNKKKNSSNPYSQSILESFRELGGSTVDTLKKDLLSPLPGDFRDQIFGIPKRSFSGEIMPGENLEMKEVVTGKREILEKEQKQVLQINTLQKEEQALVERRMGELKLQLKAIHDEIIKVVQVTNDLEQEVQIAALQSPVDPSQYELYFLQHLLSFIKSFREKAENARTWLAQQNKRASKKNVWGQNYQKMKGKYLLSKEHYLSRSAG